MTRHRALTILSENEAAQASWYREALAGLTQAADKTRVPLHILQPEELTGSAGGVILVMGNSSQFVGRAVAACRARQLRPLLVNFDSIGEAVSSLSIDRKGAVAALTRQLHEQGAERIALLGANASSHTDMAKYAGWKSALQKENPQGDSFFCSDSAKKCLSDFFDRAEEFDAVICVNDYFAVLCLQCARTRGLAVPETLRIAGFGDTRLSRCTTPPLTTISPNYAEMGEQAFRLWHYLADNPSVQSAVLQTASRLLLRESTGALPASAVPGALCPLPDTLPDAYFTLSEPEFRALLGLEAVLRTADDTTGGILHGLLAGQSYEAMAETLFLSDTALKYRLKKIHQATETTTKAGLCRLLHLAMPDFSEDCLH